MNDWEKALDKLLAKAPCVQCDGSGAIQTGEDDFEQCQFCWQLRFEFIKEAKQAINEAVLAHVIGEDETVINVVQTYANNLRAEQRKIVEGSHE